MGSEAEEEQEQEQGSAAAPPKLPLFSLSFPPMKSPEHYRWMVTPPHHSASVPFRWEEEPGKPRPCCKALSLPPSSSSSTSSSSSNTSKTTTTHFKKSLELPPRLLYEANYNNKTPSPTTVLKGPYVGKSIFHSFRLPRDKQITSFDGGGGGGGSCGTSPERGRLMGTVVLSKRWLLTGEKSRRGKYGGLFGILRKKAAVFGSKQGRRKEYFGESDGAGFLFSKDSSVGEDISGGAAGGGGGKKAEETSGRITGEKNFLGLAKTRSHFWATIYGAVKQVIPVRSKATAQVEERPLKRIDRRRKR